MIATPFWLALVTTITTLVSACTVPGAELDPVRSRVGINLSGIVDWNTEHPFVDVFRLSRTWISQKKGGPWGKGPALDLDEHGWVKQLKADCFADTLLLTGGHGPIISSV